MSDLIAPVSVNQLPRIQEYSQADVVALLFDLRTELRILNSLIGEGLNSCQDVDQLRADPYYNGFPGEANTR